MEQHPNAKLTPKGRETLVSRIESGLGVAEAARQMGISRQTAGKWLRRSRSGEGLSDRSSRPRRLARLTPPEVEERVCEARSSMLLALLGLAATAPWGAACLHVAVDDFSRVAYAELLPDERKGTCAAFMGRCLRFFEGMGVRVERVMTDNGPGYRSGEFNALLESEGARHVYTRAYSPWQNGKVERMNRTLAQEWQYARAWDGEAGRASALPVVVVDLDVVERLEELEMVEQKVCKSKGHDAVRQPAVNPQASSAPGSSRERCGRTPRSSCPSSSPR